MSARLTFSGCVTLFKKGSSLLREGTSSMVHIIIQVMILKYSPSLCGQEKIKLIVNLMTQKNVS